METSQTHSFGMLILMWVFIYFPAQMVKLKASITSMGEKNYRSGSLRFLLTMSMGLIRLSTLILDVKIGFNDSVLWAIAM